MATKKHVFLGASGETLAHVSAVDELNPACPIGYIVAAEIESLLNGNEHEPGIPLSSELTLSIVEMTDEEVANLTDS